MRRANLEVENQYSLNYKPPRKGNNLFKTITKQLDLQTSDWPFVVICFAALGYFSVNDTLFVVTLGCFSVFFLSLWHIISAIPLIEKYVGVRIRFWHIATLILGFSSALSLVHLPASAIFLSGLEEFFKTLASDAQGAGSGETISEDVITLIFNLIRGAFLLLVAGASLFAYNQAQQGNDWRPIVTQVGLAFAIVIAIDVITYLFVGDGGGSSGTP